MKNEFAKRILSSIILIPLLAFFTIKSLDLFIVFLFIVFFISFYEWIKMSKKIYLILTFQSLKLILKRERKIYPNNIYPYL